MFVLQIKYIFIRKYIFILQKKKEKIFDHKKYIC